MFDEEYMPLDNPKCLVKIVDNENPDISFQ